MTWIAIPLALVTVLATFGGGFAALRLSRDLTTAIALTGGVVVAVALFHVLPEAIEILDDPNRVGTLVGAGFLGFFLAERLLVLHHRDAPEEGARSRARRRARGRRGLDPHLHRRPGDRARVQRRHRDGRARLPRGGRARLRGRAELGRLRPSPGRDRRRAITWLSIVAIAPLLGAIVGATLDISEESLGELLAVYAGFFLFMGATDLLPHAHEHPSAKRVAVTAAGFSRRRSSSRLLAR